MSWLKNNWVYVFIIVAIVIFSLMNNFQSRSNAVEGDNNFPIELTTNELAEEGDSTTSINKQEQQLIYVDVKGAVNHPGVYQVEGEERVSDLIEMAGGFTEDAYQETVNMAQRVFDEMVIYVPVEGSTDDEIINPTVQNSKIRINLATEEEVSTLTGIGGVKASAIIQYREENGSFKTVEELLNVTGIGEKTLEKIKDQIQIP